MNRLLVSLLTLSAPLIGLGGLLAALGVAGGPLVLVAGLAALAVGCGGREGAAGFRFTAWMVALIALAMFYPSVLLKPRAFGYVFDLRNPWLTLLIVQAVMFGMGTQMRLADLAGVARTPLRVGVGLVCQFTIMPLVGYGLAVATGLPDEIAAGVVLIGCCSSGLASNVMVHMAKGDLALSVTLTTVATLMAPLVTPAWMKLLAGQFVEVDFLKMMITILKIVVVPVGAALLHDALKSATPRMRGAAHGLAAAAVAWGVLLSLGGWQWITEHTSDAAQTAISLGGFLLGAVAVGVAYHRLVESAPGVARWMPVLSMAGILYFTSVSVAAGRDELLSVGVLLLAAAALHNVLGYLLGYGLSRAVGVDQAGARTIAFEVGMQNGAMGVGLASAMGKLGTVGLAPILFSPWMGVTGSVLANYWKRTSEPTPPEESPS